jgi:hypothetical protein
MKGAKDNSEPPHNLLIYRKTMEKPERKGDGTSFLHSKSTASYIALIPYSSNLHKAWKHRFAHLLICTRGQLVLVK